MSNFELLLMCYKSGQVSERQWQEHLKDTDFVAWLGAQSDSPEGR